MTGGLPCFFLYTSAPYLKISKYCFHSDSLDSPIKKINRDQCHFISLIKIWVMKI
jgi:hypothetical protein